MEIAAPRDPNSNLQLPPRRRFYFSDAPDDVSLPAAPIGPSRPASPSSEIFRSPLRCSPASTTRGFALPRRAWCFRNPVSGSTILHPPRLRWRCLSLGNLNRKSVCNPPPRHKPIADCLLQCSQRPCRCWAEAVAPLVDRGSLHMATEQLKQAAPIVRIVIPMPRQQPRASRRYGTIRHRLLCEVIATWGLCVSRGFSPRSHPVPKLGLRGKGERRGECFLTSESKR